MQGEKHDIFRLLMYFLHNRCTHETNAEYDKRSIDPTATRLLLINFRGSMNQSRLI